MRIKAFLAGIYKFSQYLHLYIRIYTTYNYILLQETTYGTCEVRIGCGIFSEGVLPATGLYEII